MDLILKPHTIPIQEIIKIGDFKLCIKREDLIHTGISGNKYWKLFYNVKNYISENNPCSMLITFGGAYSNHIAATAFAGYLYKIPVIGIIRGEELSKLWENNPTLAMSHKLGMKFQFVSREEYQNKEKLALDYQKKYPTAKIIPEGGTNEDAILGIKNMLNKDTEEFDYLCTAIGTGGTIAGIRKYAAEHQKVLGFPVVEDSSVHKKIYSLSGGKEVQYIKTSPKGYGKINEELILFVNDFYRKYQIPLDPIYTGKMMMKLFQMIEQGYFSPNDKILAFHTGGIQGVAGVNQLLNKKNKSTIDFNPI